MVQVDSEHFPLESTRCDDAELVRVANLSVNTFSRLLRKNGGDTAMHLFQVVQLNAMRSTTKVETKVPHPKSNRIFRKYDNVFREELPLGLPPKRSVDHKLRLTKIRSRPNPLHQLSPAKLEAAKCSGFASQRENSSEQISVRRFALIFQGKRTSRRKVLWIIVL